MFRMFRIPWLLEVRLMPSKRTGKAAEESSSNSSTSKKARKGVARSAITGRAVPAKKAAAASKGVKKAPSKKPVPAKKPPVKKALATPSAKSATKKAPAKRSAASSRALAKRTPIRKAAPSQGRVAGQSKSHRHSLVASGSAEVTTLVGTVPMDEREVRQLRALAHQLRSGSKVDIYIDDRPVELKGAASVLGRIMEMAAGGTPSVLLVPTHSDVELSSQEAADLLNVSRPHVVKLARTGALPHRMVGNRHRFRVSDVEEYDQRQTELRREALASITPERGYIEGDF